MVGLTQPMFLIDQAQHAWKNRRLRYPDFTQHDFEVWIKKTGVTQPNGQPYAQSSIKALLSNSDVANRGSTNRNRKVLRSVIRNGKRYFSFI